MKLHNAGALKRSGINYFPEGENDITLPLSGVSAKSIDDGIAAFIEKHNMQAEAAFNEAKAREDALVNDGTLDPQRRTAGKRYQPTAGSP